MILVDADRISASRPGKPLFTELSVTVASGDRLAVVGINGTGKSTLLHVLAAEREPESGAVRRGRGMRVSVLDQQAALPAGTVTEVVGSGWEAASILDRLGMGALGDADIGALSGGQAKRVALARALLGVGGEDGSGTDADLLVLDEPTNHLDIDAIAWLEERLARFRGGLLLVTHDRHVLDRVSTRLVELDRGAAYVHEGGYAGYLEARARREEQRVSAETKRRNLARTELAWLRRGAPARTRKPWARVEAARELVERRPEAAARAGELPLHFGTPRLGDQVIELHGVGDGYEHLLFEGVDLSLDRRERLGIVGPNGTGKSTLLDVIAGRRAPREGRVVTGSTIRLGYYDQTGGQLDLDERVRDAVAGPTREPDWSDAALLEAFWFGDDAQWAPIRLLSGGERRRVQLLLVLAAKPNVLLLDEPTNDLDLDTLRALEDFLDEWPGALVAVSHDRAFLERTVDDVIVLDGVGRAAPVPGGFAAWEAARRSAQAAPRSRAAPTAPKPSPARTGRSPSTLRRLMKDAEKELARLTRRQAELAADLDAAGSDHVTLSRVGDELAAVAAEVGAAEEHWLALAEELET